jgi:hypothetical protein
MFQTNRFWFQTVPQGYKGDGWVILFAITSPIILAAGIFISAWLGWLQ